MPKDKSRFYKLLKEKYLFDFDCVVQDYSTFYLALKETCPLKHYKIESEIIKTMHEDTLNGKYKLTDEIEAFSIITAIIQEDEKQTIERMKSDLDRIDQTKGLIEQELLSEEGNFERLNRLFAKIHRSQKKENTHKKIATKHSESNM